MKSVKTGLGNFKLRCYYGKEEFEKYATFEVFTTGRAKPEFNPDCKGRSCINAIWVMYGDDAVTIAHELIHTLLILHDHIGIKEELPNELLAYQHSYFMSEFYKADK